MTENSPLTLDQFSAAVDDHLHYRANFADHVRAIAEAREVTKAAAARRKASFDELKARYASGERLFVVGPGERRVLVERSARPTRSKAVSSEAAKKADPALYRRAKVSTRRRSIVAPDDYLKAVEVPILPPVPWQGADLATVARLYESPEWSLLATLRDEENEHFEALDKIAADAGWDGMEYGFADGWRVKLRELRYSSDKLRAIAPKLWNDLATDIERGGGTRLVIMDYHKAVLDGYVDDSDDLDEIDEIVGN